MVYYIDCDREKRHTAGAKAPDDIACLCEKRGYSRFITPSFPENSSKLYKKIWLVFNCKSWWKKLDRKLKDGDSVIYQHPSYGKSVAASMIKKIKSKKKVCFVALVHDLESLRGGISGMIQANTALHNFGDHDLLMCFDKIICHNTHMKDYLLTKGFDEEKLVCLEIFDYLTDKSTKSKADLSEPSIAIAGNLAIGKCGYIYSICDGEHNKGLKVYLFGGRFEQNEAATNLDYQGSFKPEELPIYLKGNFGLVWDGPVADTCSGNTGEYLKYNNPHKTSLYLASGLPVVVWSQAAIADFVKANKVGIVVDSLYELQDRLSSLSEEEYNELLGNVSIISKRLKEGYYFYKAIDSSLA